MAWMISTDFEVFDAEDGRGWTFPASRRHYRTAAAAAAAALEMVRVLQAQATTQLIAARESDRARMYAACDRGRTVVVPGATAGVGE